MKPIVEVHYTISRETSLNCYIAVQYRIGIYHGEVQKTVKEFKEMITKIYPNYNLVFLRHYKCFKRR